MLFLGDFPVIRHSKLDLESNPSYGQFASRAAVGL